MCERGWVRVRAVERRVCGMCAACVGGIERASKQVSKGEGVEEEEGVGRTEWTMSTMSGRGRRSSFGRRRGR